MQDQDLINLEDILIQNEDISWIALARDLSLQNKALCTLIKAHCVDYFRLPLEGMQQLDFCLEHANGMAYLRQRTFQTPIQSEQEMGRQFRCHDETVPHHPACSQRRCTAPDYR